MARTPWHPYSSWDEWRAAANGNGNGARSAAGAEQAGGHFAAALAHMHGPSEQAPPPADQAPAPGAPPAPRLRRRTYTTSSTRSRPASEPDHSADAAPPAANNESGDSNGTSSDQVHEPPVDLDAYRRLAGQVETELSERLPLLRRHFQEGCTGCDRLLAAYEALLPTLVALREEVAQGRDSVATTRSAVIDALRGAFPLQVDDIEHGARPVKLATLGPYELADHLVAWAQELREESVRAGEQRAQRDHQPLRDANEGLRQNLAQVSARASKLKDEADALRTRLASDLTSLGADDDTASAYIDGRLPLARTLHQAATAAGRVTIALGSGHGIELVAHRPGGAGIPTQGTLADLVPSDAPPPTRPPPGVDPSTGEVHTPPPDRNGPGNSAAGASQDPPQHSDPEPQQRGGKRRERKPPLKNLHDIIEQLRETHPQVLDALYRRGDITLGRLIDSTGVAPSDLRNIIGGLVAAQAAITLDAGAGGVFVVPTHTFHDAVQIAGGFDDPHPNVLTLANFTTQAGLNDALRPSAPILARLVTDGYSLSSLSAIKRAGPNSGPVGAAAIVAHGAPDGSTTFPRGMIAAFTGPGDNLRFGADPGHIDICWIAHPQPAVDLLPPRLTRNADRVVLVPADTAHDPGTWQSPDPGDAQRRHDKPQS